MFSYSKTAALIALAALTAPAICQAQDIVGALGQAEKLNKSGRAEDAIKLCNAVLKKLESNSNVAKQFQYMTPFYYWQRALAQVRLQKYDDAYVSFGKIAEDPRWKDATLKQRAKDAQAMASGKKTRAVGYDPLLTMSLFQMGYVRFKQATGDGGAAADPKKFEDAIKCLESYLKLLESGAVSAQEKEKKLNGQVCFLLLQSYLLKENPDFTKGAEYLERSRKGKGKLPEDMVINGLTTIMEAALDDKKGTSAEVMDLAYKALSTIPGMDPTVSAPYISKYINYGSQAASISQQQIKAGNLPTAEAAARIMSTVFAMVPGTEDVLAELELQSKTFGKDESVTVPADSGTGRRTSVKLVSNLTNAYDKLLADHTDPEAIALLSRTNVNLTMGSNRMGKAGFQVLLDRYPDLTTKNKEGKADKLAPKLTFQLAQLHYITGNEAEGQKLESSLAGVELEEDYSKNLVFNQMRRLLSEGQWAEVIPVAEHVVEVNKDAPSGIAAATAQFVICAANFKVGKPDVVVEKGEAFLASGNLKPGIGKNSLKPEQVADYEHQLYFFIIDSYNKLGATNPANYDKAIETFAKFREKYPSNDDKENKLISNTVYTVVDSLLKRAAVTADEEASKADIAKALEYTKLIADTWPNSDVYPVAQLLRGNILINGEDEAAKPEGIPALQHACDAALKQADGKGKPIAANALFLLYSYGPEFRLEGETDEALNARMKGLSDLYWSQADHEGNAYALDMIGTQLRRDIKNKVDKATFEADLAKAREVIAREATYAFKNNATNKGLEMAINSYVQSYVEGSASICGQELTTDQVIQHLDNFPGIQPEDKYTQAILYMARISQMQRQVDAIRNSMKEGADNAAKATQMAQLRENIQAQTRQMRNKFKPDDLTDFICLQVGDNLTNFVEAVGYSESNSEDLKDAVSYYEKVIERKGAQVMAASVGKARAAKLAGDLDSAITILTDVTAPGACHDATVGANALYLLTEAYLQKGDNAKALATGKSYLNNRSATRRIEMNMLLANAYQKSGDDKNALVTYMNIYSSNKGNVKYSAPACAAMMKLLWERNTPTTGDRLSRDFKNSDRWNAWNTGADYVKVLKNNKFEEKMNSEERTAFREVEKLVEQYGSDPAVQREESDNKRFRQQLGK